MRPHPLRSLLALATGLAVGLRPGPGLVVRRRPCAAPAPSPGTPAYVARDAQNIRTPTAASPVPAGSCRTRRTSPALVQASHRRPGPAARRSRPRRRPGSPVTAGHVVPGWNVGNPLRAGWNGTRGLSERISFTNRYGALLHGTVYRPKPGARDPYTGQVLKGPVPRRGDHRGLGAGQRGDVPLAGPGPRRARLRRTHLRRAGPGRRRDPPPRARARLRPATRCPFCNPFATPKDGEAYGCPGVPFQQLSNFVVGTEDALSFFTSTPSKHYANPRSEGAKVSAFNPYWQLFDRAPDTRTATPGPHLEDRDHRPLDGRRRGLQGAGHRQAGGGGGRARQAHRARAPTARSTAAATSRSSPRWALQSEYGFTVSPYLTSGGSSLTPSAVARRARTRSASGRPGTTRGARPAWTAWSSYPRASTHLEYTDIPLVLPASRYGQDLSSHYVQAWLDRYLKHQSNDAALTGTHVPLPRAGRQRACGSRSPCSARTLLSFYYCSAYGFRSGSRVLSERRPRRRRRLLHAEALVQSRQSRGRIGHGHASHRPRWEPSSSSIPAVTRARCGSAGTTRTAWSCSRCGAAPSAPAPSGCRSRTSPR